MERTIYLENLHPDVDASSLCKKFETFGKILSANIECDEHFVSICKGHILFQNQSSPKVSLKMNGVLWRGKPMVVKLANTKLNSIDINKTYTKLFVKNIFYDWDDNDLLELFEKFGEVINAKISETEGNSNGYGFVTFKLHSSAKEAINKMNGKVMGSKVLIVEPYIPCKTREDLKENSLEYAKDKLQKSMQLNNLHVKNLPKSIDESKLRNLFEQFGYVTSVKIVKNEAQESKGFGFVAFKSEKEAERALLRMNGYTIESKVLEVNFNQRKEERQKYLQLLKAEPQTQKKTQKLIYGKKGDSPSKFSEPIFSFSTKRNC